MLLACVGNDVERAHDETGTVTDDSDLAVELDVVEVCSLGLGLEGVGSSLVFESFVVGVTERSILVERDLAVERDDVALFGENQRVDLNERCVFTGVDVVQLDDDRSHLVDKLGGELGSHSDALCLGEVDALDGVDLDAGKGLGTLNSELLDLHATLVRREREVGTVGTVEEHREVELLGDAGAAGDHDALDDVTLDVQTENGLGVLFSLFGGLGDLDTASLTAATDLDLSLDDGDATELLSGSTCLSRGVGDDAGKHGNPVALEHVTRLVFVQIHGDFPIR